MYALDTNILVYAHNIASPYHHSAKTFLETILNERDADNQLAVCVPAQVLQEFLHVITWQRLEAPLPLHQAIQIVQDYLNTGVTILYQRPTQLVTLLELLENVSSRRKMFDVALVATLKDHGVSGLYTVNTTDFEEFSFLNVQNPLN